MQFLLAFLILIPPFAAVAQAQCVICDVGEQRGPVPHVGGVAGHAVRWGDVVSNGRPGLIFRYEQPEFGLDEQQDLRMPGRAVGAVFADLDNDGGLERPIATDAIDGAAVISASLTRRATCIVPGEDAQSDERAACDRREGRHPQYRVTEPPARLKLPDFYKKCVDAHGYPIVSSGRVNDYALKEAAYLVDLLLARRSDVRKTLIEGGSRLVVIAHSEFTTDVPEYSKLTPKDYWDARARGLGGSQTDPVCSCGEENLLAYRGDPYSAENILIHEFAHSIHLRGMARIDGRFDDRLKSAYETAMREGLWAGTYASTNHHEYFAEGVQSWFDNNRPPDHDHNHVDTRKELRAYDRGLAALCEEVFGGTGLAYTKPTTRLVGHLEGYDPSAAPAFEWPDRLQKAREEIRRKARARRAKAERR